MLSLQIQGILKSGPDFPSKQQTANLGKRKAIIHCTRIMAHLPLQNKTDKMDISVPSLLGRHQDQQRVCNQKTLVRFHCVP